MLRQLNFARIVLDHDQSLVNLSDDFRIDLR